MKDQSIYSTYLFKDINNGQLLLQLMLRNHANQFESIKRTLVELTEKFCLSESEIVIVDI